jgi:hypothetical protein
MGHQQEYGSKTGDWVTTKQTKYTKGEGDNVTLLRASWIARVTERTSDNVTVSQAVSGSGFSWQKVDSASDRYTGTNSSLFAATDVSHRSMTAHIESSPRLSSFVERPADGPSWEPTNPDQAAGVHRC